MLVLWLGFLMVAIEAKSGDIVNGQFRAARFRRELAARMPVRKLHGRHPTEDPRAPGSASTAGHSTRTFAVAMCRTP